ncbi:hypothetical protein LTR66_012435 [Elasticomyces elasticus]|nr:hypothetical protein LTR66_012435 [Elasticomyces elasticus]KAK4987688.1 hypothetical protein LTR50_004435 [Elasticomyces elasticus]
MSKGRPTGSSVFDIAKEPGEQMGNYVEGSVWYYAPNKVAPIIFAVLFFGSGALHAWQTWRYKSWRVTLLLPWAALLFAGGFAAREAGAFHVDDVGILIASYVLLLSGPPVFAGANYFILARLFYYIPYIAPLHPSRVVTLFIGLDLVVEILIANGASKIANPNLPKSEILTGQILVKTSLVIQAVLFFFFIGLAVVFHVRATKAGLLIKNIKKVVWALYVSSVLITVRCIFRIVEFFEGYTGYVNTHEPFFYIFEAVLMLVNSVVLNLFHPAQYFPRSGRVFLARDGVTEIEGPGWHDRRVWWRHLVDPLDLWGLLVRKNRSEKYWEEVEYRDRERTDVSEEQMRVSVVA